jgi:hypothetical protein
MEGWLKVGKSKNPHTRLQTLQTAAPFDYEILMLTEFFCDKPIHNRLIMMGIESKREWFKTDLSTIESVINEVLEEWANVEHY